MTINLDVLMGFTLPSFQITLAGAEYTVRAIHKADIERIQKAAQHSADENKAFVLGLIDGEEKPPFDDQPELVGMVVSVVGLLYATENTKHVQRGIEQQYQAQGHGKR